MTSQYILSAIKRENFGKRATKRYRRENLVPAEIYGISKDNQSVLVNGFELDNQTKDPQFYSNVIDLSVDDKKVEVILKDVQRDPAKSNITHIDFLMIDQNVKIEVNVPIKFINEDICNGVKVSGGKLSHIISETLIICLPKDIPEHLEADVASLELNHSLHLSEITLPSGVELVSGTDKESDTAIIKCYMPAEEVIEDDAPEELDAPEATNVKADDVSSEENKDENKDDKKVDSKEDK
ncbi:MAG: 50S ribosomal protein L25/general stress protein Ctc [Gammaproteobacteria bacterium]|jgi:large subunit ribosomal protein L25|nr:50S ribosomal protein L25/general stress protein Ctc [Gammaproteobacteria bacterium]MBT4462611.1 50S ribosomal protein L25/general stress protein Ctc [Gammaproteobacteria bacterium]MBT4654858.1 50S ribosomal protein L25/general stress protein Ctc [Gammaproteobacteria bacterium]MBT5761731.1 50S ribosomal protein L25/general stress protein Ctc [Gammaproteobacteria bacterium]MBT6331249.1 50S ribosomal protein L25/general stress protein Ctc [Gammaproteobacteria bacterium]